jgi:signal transduction histidine kinase
MRKDSQKSRAMVAMTQLIGGSLDVPAVLRAVGDTARAVLGVDRVHIFLGSDPRQLRVAYLGGLPHPVLSEGQLVDLVSEGSKMQRQALESRELLCVDDWEADDRVNKDLARRWGIASAVHAPLVARNQALGLLVLSSATPQRWTDERIEVAEALAAQASVALDNARLNEGLRQAVNQLKDAQQRIRQNERMAVVGTFASGLAHEVRNPLNSMALQLALLERRIAALGSEQAEQMQELTQIIREEIRRLDALVGDFLLFSLTKRINCRPACLDSLIDDVVRLLRPEGRAAGVLLKRHRPEAPLPKLPMDTEKMKQVFINLIRNAIEAMPDGGIVSVESELVAGNVRVTVRDNGPGLPEGLDVFQLFVSTKTGGTGLGLSIAQQIVLDHGGEIAVERASAGGTVFTVALPLETEKAAVQEAKRPVMLIP